MSSCPPRKGRNSMQLEMLSSLFADFLSGLFLGRSHPETSYITSPSLMDESWGKFQERKGERSDLDEQNDGGDDDKK